MVKLPGLIDPHVHFRDPGQTTKEDFYSGTTAAIFGGFTTVMDMPNNKEPIVNKERLDEKIKIAKEKTVCNIGFYFGSLGDNLDEFKKVEQTVFGLKLYLNETTGNFLIDIDKLRKIFDAWNGGPILLHAEDDAVAEVINNVRRTKKRAHFCHISTQRDLEQIIEAKEEGLPISCGVTPHHLFLNESDTQRLGPYGRMKPFLKTQKDVDFLWKNIDSIDIVESDHAPHTKVEKDSPTPPFGVPGLETTLPLLMTKLEVEQIIRLCHEGARDIFGIPTNDQTYIEVDENSEFSILNSQLHTKCGWSPFEGTKAKGKVTKVVIDGKTVMENNKLLAKEGSGKVLTKS